MTNRSELQLAFRAAFPATIPILAGFLFLGIAYGIFMNISGFGAGYAFLMSLLIFAGSMEFVAVHLLLGAFNPLGAFFLALMVNARHLFYGISMLEPRESAARGGFRIIGCLQYQRREFYIRQPWSARIDFDGHCCFLAFLEKEYAVIDPNGYPGLYAVGSICFLKCLKK
ncbi:hypothetical protein PAMA110636_20515 [Paenibacillus macerans]